MRRFGSDNRALVDELDRDAMQATTHPDWQSAEVQLRASLAVDSTGERANVVLLRLLIAEGRAAEARALLTRMAARAIAPGVLVREGAALASSGGSPPSPADRHQ